MFGITPAHMKLYMEEETPLNHVASLADVACISGCLFASAAVGAIICGLLSQRIGPRAMLLLSGLLQISSWFCIHFGYDILHIYSSRVFGGLAAGATFIVLPIFIAEISEEQNISSLIATIEQWRTVGIMIGFILGQYLQYEYVGLVAACISCAFTMMFPFSQESPYYYMRQGDITGLEKSLRWFRGVRRMSDRNRPEFLRELNGFKSNMEINTIADKNIPLNYLLRMTLYTVLLVVGVQLSGVYVIFTWSEQILSNNVFINLSTDVSVVILSVTQFVGTTITVWLAPLLTRKLLLFSAALICAGASLGLALCICIEVREELKWASSGLLLVHIFFANMGLYPLISLIPTEMVHTQLRFCLTSLSWALSWLMIFILVQYYEYFLTLIGLHGYFIIFGVSCTCVAAFALFLLPETRGKTSEELQQIMGYENSANVSQINISQSEHIRQEQF
ncbi:facilitated trehalose transporter Tret1 isoform X2 [Eurosta solidaginis]